MTTSFKSLCQSCGFKMMEAADFLAVSPDTVKSWWIGRRNCPDGVKSELFELLHKVGPARFRSTIESAPELPKD